MNNSVQIWIFTSKTCVHCHKLVSMLEDSEVKKEINADVKVLDINENVKLVNQYDITAVPTILFFYNEELKDKIVGNTSKNVLKATISRITQQ